MDATSQNKPQLYRHGHPLLAGTMAADPSLTIIDVYQKVGLLLAESCYEDALGRFHLENVIWIRVQDMLILHPVHLSTFEDVLLHRLEGGLFVAQDKQSAKVIPHPSTAPYFTIFVSQQELENLKSEMKNVESGEFPKLTKQKIEELPGFTCDGLVIMAPAGYATADTRKLGAEIIDDDSRGLEGLLE
jgi:hypothetical protein